MKHKSISLPEKLWDKLARIAKSRGVSVGELIRSIIAYWDGTK